MSPQPLLLRWVFPQAKQHTHPLQTTGAVENLLLVPHGFNWLENNSKRTLRWRYWGSDMPVKNHESLLAQAKHQAAQTLALVCRIALKSGGDNSHVRQLVRAVLQPHFVYPAQFQLLCWECSGIDWKPLIGRLWELLLAFPCITPIVPLEKRAQLNTLDELVHHSREARQLKALFCYSAWALIVFCPMAVCTVKRQQANWSSSLTVH